MITDILFDLGNVLAPLDWNRAYARLIPHLPHGMAELLRSDRTAFENIIDGPCVDLETGKLGFGDFYRTISGKLGLEIHEQLFHHIWCDIFDVDRDIVVMGRWMAQCYGTWLLSNTSEAHYRWIVETFPEVVFYQGAALSYDLGVMKPAREYFIEALRRFDIDPAAAVFIDDREENVEGAVRVGINGIVYRGRAPLVRELRKLDVIVPDGVV
jgi:hypothetical protein